MTASPCQFFLPKLAGSARHAFAAWVWSDDREPAWRAFLCLGQRGERHFGPRQPPGWPAAGRGEGGGDGPAPSGSDEAAVTAATMATCLALMRRHGRVCPRPDLWQVLYDLLPDKQKGGRVQVPLPPVSAAAWRVYPVMAKRLVLREHIEWAARKGVLQEVHDFLAGLPEADWEHEDSSGRA